MGRLGYVALIATMALFGLRQAAGALEPQCAADAACALALPRRLLIEGWIATSPAQRSGRLGFDLDLRAAHLAGKWRPVHGRVRVWARGLSTDWKAGACLRGRLWMRQPRNFGNPGAFDYVAHLRRRGVTATASIWQGHTVERCKHRRDGFHDAVARLRSSIAGVIDAAIVPEHAGLVRALVVGDVSGLSTALRRNYARAGVAHLLAISGLHLAVVGGAAFGTLRVLTAFSQTLLARGLPTRLAAAGTLPFVLGYGILAGARAPTVRAVIMLGVYLIGVLCHRRVDLWRGLALAALMLSVGVPGTAFDPSFAFSFGAVASIGIGLRVARGRVPRRRSSTETLRVENACVLRQFARVARRWITSSVIVSTAATLGTAPLAAYHFNLVSLVGPVANIVAVPVYSAGIVSALAATTIAMVHSDAGRLLFTVTGALIDIGHRFVTAVAALPAAAVRTVTPTPLELGLVYASATVSMVRHRVRPVLLTVLAVVALGDAAYWIQERYYRPTLRVTYLDVGQGDAAVVEFPGSAVLVIDAGGFAGSDFDTGEAVVARFLWRRKIGRVNYVAMSHADIDHAGGLPYIVRQFRPREFWWNGISGRGASSERLRAALQAERVVQRVVSRDVQAWHVGPVEVAALQPARIAGAWASANDASLVLRLRWGRVRLLFTGDIERRGEEALLRLPSGTVRSTVLKVPHHGSRTSSTTPFLDGVRPVVAVVSVGARNRYGFPAAEVRARYRARDVCLLRTDRDGAIALQVDGHGYSIDPSCAVDR